MQSASHEIVGVLLAAGTATRFGSDKLMHPLADGTPIVIAAAANLLPACDRVVAVVRDENCRLADALATAGCEIVRCAEAHKGMGHSLAAGVHATPDAAGWIVALGDMPFIATSSHQAVATRLRTGASLVATQYQGQRGHPVGFSNRWFAELLALTGDQGAQTILAQQSQQLVLCTVEDPGALRDIDRPVDLVS